jgi:hypothetical protein
MEIDDIHGLGTVGTSPLIVWMRSALEMVGRTLGIPAMYTSSSPISLADLGTERVRSPALSEMRIFEMISIPSGGS